MAGQPPDERDVHIGRRIERQRKVAGLSRKLVAERLGITPSQLLKYERGTNRISAVYLESVSRLTNVPVAAFFEGMPHRAEDAGFGLTDRPQADLAVTDGWSDLVDATARFAERSLDQGGRQRFAAAADALARRLRGADSFDI